MGRTYAKHLTNTPQSEPIPGSKQVANNAGGYSYAVDDWKQLERFLIIGSTDGTYYVSEHKLTVDNAVKVIRLIQADGSKVVDMILDIARNRRAPKPNPSIFTMALVLKHGDEKARKRIYNEAIPTVCYTQTQLNMLLAECKTIGKGWSRGLRNAIPNWYYSKGIEGATHQMLKYRNREGYTPKDLIRLSHPYPSSDVLHSDEWRSLFAWAALDGEKAQDAIGTPAQLISTFNTMQSFTEKDHKVAAQFIKANRIVREYVPTGLLNSPDIWEALLEHMPMTAMIRNLGVMASKGLLTTFSDSEMKVVSVLQDAEAIKKSRIHPMALYLAAETYASGFGKLGAKSWTVNQRIVAALEEGYKHSFVNVIPTNKRIFIGVDISGSMSGLCGQCGALVHITLQTEPNVALVGVNTEVNNVNVNRNSSMRQCIQELVRINNGGTDLSKHIEYLYQSGINADAIITYTDSETWAGNRHPQQWLTDYRKKVRHPVKNVVVSMTATNLTVADPDDLDALNIAGFDPTVPSLIADFIK